MFAIYEKTEEEINLERALDVKKKYICPYSIPVFYNEEIVYLDTYDLTDDQILSLIQQDILEFVNPFGFYARMGIKTPMLFDLIRSLRPNYYPSTNMVLQLALMETLLGNVITRIMRKLNCGQKLTKAKRLARKLKTDNNDTGEITPQDIIEALQMMFAEEQEKRRLREEAKQAQMKR